MTYVWVHNRSNMPMFYASGHIHENIGILPKDRPAFFIRIHCFAAPAPASASARVMLALRGASSAWGKVQSYSEGKVVRQLKSCIKKFFLKVVLGFSRPGCSSPTR